MHKIFNDWFSDTDTQHPCETGTNRDELEAKDGRQLKIGKNGHDSD